MTILDTRQLLVGDLELLGLMPGASNYTFLARLQDLAGTSGPEGTTEGPLVVYKPRRGETPLWDFPSGTLCQRETAAYLISAAGGFDVVPPTILREGPYGVGSVQAFVEHDFECTAFDLFESSSQALRRIALFDLVVNNADRKAGHVFPDAGGRVWGIDHGICFHVEPKLRTVLWDFAGEEIADEERACLRRLRVALGPPAGTDPAAVAGAGPTELSVALAGLLDADELRALRRRLRAALAAKVFPMPGPGRNFPWPPV